MGTKQHWAALVFIAGQACKTWRWVADLKLSSWLRNALLNHSLYLASGGKGEKGRILLEAKINYLARVPKHENLVNYIYADKEGKSE